MPAVRWMLLACAIVVAEILSASALPDDPYLRFQLAGGPVNAGLKTTYERIRFDPTPIDVAIIGSSRTMLGVSESRLETDLATRGTPAHVANLSVFGDGRNLQWVVTSELFRYKSPRTLVLALYDAPPVVGHPTFRFAASAGDVVKSAALRVASAPGDLLYLPYRQLRLLAARLAPGAFAAQPAFNPSAYRAQYRDHSFSFRASSGLMIDMTSVNSPAALRAGRAVEEKALQRPFPRLLRKVVSDDEATYIDRIAALAAAHRCRIVFVFVPQFEGSPAIPGYARYARLGPVLTDADLRNDATKFSSWNHLNRAGAVIVTDRLADTVAAALRSDDRVPRS